MSKPGTSPRRPWVRRRPGGYVYRNDAHTLVIEVEGPDAKRWDWFLYDTTRRHTGRRGRGCKTRQEAQVLAETAMAETLKPYAMEYLALTGQQAPDAVAGDPTEDAGK